MGKKKFKNKKTGQKLFLKAKKIIPSGNMMISKNPELFLSDGWPTYFKKQKLVMCGISIIRNTLICH